MEKLSESEVEVKEVQDSFNNVDAGTVGESSTVEAFPVEEDNEIPTNPLDNNVVEPIPEDPFSGAMVDNGEAVSNGFDNAMVEENDHPPADSEKNHAFDLLESNVLDYDNYLPEVSRAGKDASVVMDYMKMKYGFQHSNSTDYELIRNNIAFLEFGEENGLDDAGFVKAIQGKAQNKIDRSAYLDEFNKKVFESHFSGESGTMIDIINSMGETTGSDLVEGAELSKIHDAVREGLEEKMSAKGLKLAKDLFENFKSGDREQVFDGAKIVFDGLSDEHREEVARHIGFVASKYSRKERDSIADYLGKSLRGVAGTGRSLSNFAVKALSLSSSVNMTRRYNPNKGDYISDKKKTDAFFENKINENEFIEIVLSSFENKYDPTQFIVDKDSVLGSFERGAHQIPTAIATTAVALIPYAGVPLTYGIMYEEANKSLVADSFENGATLEQARRISAVPATITAVPSMILERFGAKGVIGKSEALKKIQGKIAGKFKNKFLTRGAVGLTGETITELGQGIIAESVKDIAHEYEELFSDVQWVGEGGFFDNYHYTIIETATAASASSFGGAILQNKNQHLELLDEASDLEKRAVGYSAEALAKFEDSRGTFDQERAFDELVASKDGNSEEAIEATHDLADKIQTQNEAIDVATIQGILPRVDISKEGFDLIDTHSNESVGKFETSSEVQEALQDYLKERSLDSDRIIDYLESMILGAENLLHENLDQGLEERYELRLGEQMDTETMSQVSQEYADRIKEEVHLEEVASGGDGSIARAILGMSETEFEDGQKVMVNKIFAGATLSTVIHESAHGQFRRSIETGALTIPEAIQFFRKIDETLEGDSFLTSINDEDVTFTEIDEAVSKWAESEILRTRNGKSSNLHIQMARNANAVGGTASDKKIKTKFANIRNAMKKYFGLAMIRAVRMRKAINDGLIQESEVDEFRAKLQGTSEVEEHTRQVVEEGKVYEIDTPFSIGEARMTPTSGEMVNMGNAIVSTEATSFSIGAYHGTPHDVAKFSTKNIGSGEGAQAYGWGLYFAQDRKVGEAYKQFLGRSVLVNGEVIYDGLDRTNKGVTTGDQIVDDLIISSLGDRSEIDSFMNQLKISDFDLYEKTKEILDSVEIKVLDNGNLYRVELNVEEEDLLLWDKPLSDNPLLETWLRNNDWGSLVDASLEADKGNRETLRNEGYKSAYFGHVGSLYEFIQSEHGGDKGLSEALASIGIKGIKYLDGNSRGGGEGNYNYVIFNEEDIKITERNDTPVSSEASFSTGEGSIDGLVTPKQDAEYLELAKDPEGNKEVLQNIINSRLSNVPDHAVEYAYNYEGVELSVFGSDDFENAKVTALLSSKDNSIHIDTVEASSEAKGLGYGKALYAAVARYAQENFKDTITGSTSEDALFVRKRLFDTSVKELDGYSNSSSIVLPNIEYTPKSYKESEDSDYNVIPLSERFNESSNDIRFSIGHAGVIDGLVTPKQDAEYLELAKDPEGNKEELEAMVEKMAKLAGYDSPKVYHGTNKKFSVFDTEGRGKTHGSGAFFTTNERNASTYGGNVVSAFLMTDGHRVDAGGSNWNSLKVWEAFDHEGESLGEFDSVHEAMEEAGEEGSVIDFSVELSEEEGYLVRDYDSDESSSSTDDISRQAREMGWGSIVFDNIIDSKSSAIDFSNDSARSPSSVYVVFNPNQIKSAEAVTYDDNGNVIPLSERFNESSDDIRFSIGHAGVIDGLVKDVGSRVRDPKKLAEIMVTMLSNLDKTRSDIDREGVAFGKDYLKKAVAEPQFKKDLKVQMAKIREAKEEELVNEASSRYEFFADREGEEIFKIKQQPIHAHLAHPTNPLKGDLMSKSRATAEGRYDKEKHGDYDGASEASPTLFGGSTMPDQAAQELYEMGLLSEPSVDALWDSLARERKSVLGNQEILKQAKIAKREAISEARKHAKDWYNEQVKIQEKDNSPIARMRRWLVQLDAITNALPIELRGKIGGSKQLSKFSSDEKALEFLKEKVELVDEVASKWISDQTLKGFDNLLEKAEPNNDTGKKPKGKIGAEGHRIFDKIREVINLSELEVQQKENNLNLALGKAEISDAEIVNIGEDLQIVQTYGGLKEKGTKEIVNALTSAEEIYRTNKNKWRITEENRLNNVAEKVTEILNLLGNPEAGDVQKAKKLDKKVLQNIKNLDWKVVSFPEVMDKLLGRDDELGKYISNSVNRAFEKRTIAISKAHKRWRKASEDATGLTGRQAKLAIWKMQDEQTIKVDLKSVKSVDSKIPIETFLNAEQRSSLGLSSSEIKQVSLEIEALKEGHRNKYVTIERTVTNVKGSSEYTESEAIYLTMLYAQDGYKESMAFHGFGAEVQEQLEKQISKAGKAMRQHMANEYKDNYEPLRKLYASMYGVNLPSINNYTPGIHYSVGKDTSLDITGSGIIEGGLRQGFAIGRKKHNAEPKAESAFAVYFNHLNQTEHWLAVAEISREMGGIFNNAEVKKALESIDLAIPRLIPKWLEAVDGNGLNNGVVSKMGEWVYSTNSAYALAWKGATLAKNFIGSSVNGAFNMDIIPFFKGYGRLMGGKIDMKKIWNSDVLQARIISGFSPEQRAAISKSFEGKPTLLNEFVSKGFDLIGIADAMGTTMSASIVYDHHYNLMLDEVGHERAEAIALEEAANSMARTAQPVEVPNRSMFELESTSFFAKTAFAFKSEARQKSSITVRAWANILSGKADKRDVQRVIVAHFVVAPMMYAVTQISRDVLNGDDDELFDEKYWNARGFMMSVGLGPLAGLPLISELFDGYNSDDAGPLSRVADAFHSSFDLLRGESDHIEDDVIDAIQGFGGSAGAAAGNVYNQFMGLIENFSE